MKHKLKEYAALRDGNFAIWFALSAFPVLVLTSLVLDFRKADGENNAVKQALDVSVLAAVSNDKINEEGKKALAEKIFAENYSGDMAMTFDVKVDDGRVEMTAEGKSGTTIGRAVGKEGFDIKETSIAVMNRENTICVLALAEKGKEKLRFLGSTNFNSPTCSVQSNSQDDQGILSTSRYTPTAKSFCSAGGAKGTFAPAMRGECRVIDDPYENKSVPKPGICMPQTIFSGGGGSLAGVGNLTDAGGTSHIWSGALAPSHVGVPGANNITKDKHEHAHCHLDNPSNCHVGVHNVSTLHGPLTGLRLSNLGVSAAEIRRLLSDYGPDMFAQAESVNYTQDNGVYYPGTYCGGLTVDGRNVKFTPGVYIIKDGPLTFKNGAVADAENVSFVLTGENAVVTVESGSYVTVKAPKDGPMAGLALYQAQYNQIETGGDLLSGPKAAMMSNSTGLASGGGGPKSSGSNYPSGVNLLSSGGELNVTGTMYFPTQALDVLGNSVLGAKAPATSFIAYQVTFAGETKAEVSVDYVKADIPPMLPKSDDGARLIK